MRPGCSDRRFPAVNRGACPGRRRNGDCRRPVAPPSKWIMPPIKAKPPSGKPAILDRVVVVNPGIGAILPVAASTITAVFLLRSPGLSRIKRNRFGPTQVSSDQPAAFWGLAAREKWRGSAFLVDRPRRAQGCILGPAKEGDPALRVENEVAHVADLGRRRGPRAGQNESPRLANSRRDRRQA